MTTRIKHLPVAAALMAAALTALAQPTARAADEVVMHLDFLINGYHAPFYIAQKKGWYREAGIDATIRPGRGTADSIKNVGSGNAQFGFPSFGAAAAAVAEGVPLMAVAAYLQEVPGGFVSFESNPVREPADLEGKSIAVAPFGATAILLPAFLKKNGVDAGKVNAVTSNFGAIVPSFLTGKVDASIGYYFGEYLAARDKMAGSGKKVLFMRVSDFGVRAYGNGLVVNSDFMASNPDATRRFIEVTMRGIEYTVDNIAEAAAAAAEHTETPVALLTKQLELAMEMINNQDAMRHGFGTMVKEKWDDTQSIQVEFGGQKELVPDERLWTNRFVE